MATRGPDAGGSHGRLERRQDTSVNSGSTEAARILIVEDQDDVRRMLATALSIEGHQVDEASSAAEGLKCLQQSRYSLVLSDYAMPGGTGTWMLHQASEQGLMNGTVALIVTTMGVVVPLILHWFVQGTRLDFLFRRPAFFHIDGARRPALQPAE